MPTTSGGLAAHTPCHHPPLIHHAFPPPPKTYTRNQNTHKQEDSYAEIIKELDALPASLPRPVFEILLKKIYKRSK